MPVLPEAITEGGKYITEENSLGHSQIKEVLKISPDRQNFLCDAIEYRSKVSGSTAPWVMHTCMRKTFAGSIARHADKAAA